MTSDNLFYMHTINVDFAVGFFIPIESGTPTWHPIRIEGHERAQRGLRVGTAGGQPHGAPVGFFLDSNSPLLEPLSQRNHGKRTNKSCGLQRHIGAVRVT